MEQPKQVGIWIRVSTDDQAKGESPEHHEKRGRLYAEAKGWEVREVYHLEALTGKSVMQYALSSSNSLIGTSAYQHIGTSNFLSQLGSLH